VPDITQVLKLVAQADTSGLAAMRKGLDDLQDSGSKVGSIAGTALKGITIAATGGAAAMVAGIGASVKTASDFQQKMLDLQAATGVTSDELQQLHDAALQVGKDTPKSASEAAEAFTELAKAGVSVKDIVGGIGRTVVDMATATGAAVPDMANLLVAGMQSFGASATEASQYANVLSAAAQASTLDIGDFARALQTGGATAKSANLSIADFSAAVAVLGNNGIQGAEAGTMLKTMLLDLEAPSSRGKAALDSINVSVFDAQGKMKPFAQLLGELSDGFSGLTEEERDYTAKAIFGTYGINAANILLKDHAKGYQDMTEAMGKQLSVADQTKIRMQGLSGAIEQFKGSVETLMIRVGEKFLPFLTSIASGATDAVNGLLDADWSGVEHVFGVVADAGGAAFAKIGQIITEDVVPAAKDVAHWIGDVAAPAVQSFVSEEVLPRLEKFGGLVQDVAGYLKDVVFPVALDKIRDALGWIGDHKETVVGAIAALTAVWLANAAAATAAAVAEAAAALPFIAIAAAVAALGAGIALLITHWDDITQKFPILGQIADTVGGKLDQFRTFLVNDLAPRAKEAFDAIVSKVQDVIAWVQEHWDGIKALLAGPFEIAKGLIQGQIDGVKDIIETGLKVVQDIIKIALDLISGNWGKAWDDIKGLLSDVWTGIKTFVGDQVNDLETVLSGAWTTIRNTAEQIWNEIGGKIEGAITEVKNKLGDVGSGILGGIHDAVTGAGHAIWQWFTDRADDITHAITHPFDAAASAMKGIVNLILDPLRLAIGGINTFGKGITGAVDFVLEHVGLGDHKIGPWLDIANIPQFARGVTNWRGGFAWVGEAGPEIMYVPAGASILPADQSQKLAPVLAAAGLPGFQFGLGDLLGDVGDFFKNAASDVVSFVKEWTAKGVAALVDHALDLFGVHGLDLPAPFDAMGPKLFGMVKDAIVSAVTHLFTGANTAFAANIAPAANGDLSPQQLAAGLRAAGMPDSAIPTMVAILLAESGGNIGAGSGAGALGFAQFMPGTAAKWGVTPAQLVSHDPADIAAVFRAVVLEWRQNGFTPWDAYSYVAGNGPYGEAFVGPGQGSFRAFLPQTVGLAAGGIIGEPIEGIGLTTGTRYRFGENGPETVTPGANAGDATNQWLAAIWDTASKILMSLDGKIAGALDALAGKLDTLAQHTGETQTATADIRQSSAVTAAAVSGQAVGGESPTPTAIAATITKVMGGEEAAKRAGGLVPFTGPGGVVTYLQPGDPLLATQQRLRPVTGPGGVVTYLQPGAASGATGDGDKDTTASGFGVLAHAIDTLGEKTDRGNSALSQIADHTIDTAEGVDHVADAAAATAEAAQSTAEASDTTAANTADTASAVGDVGDAVAGQTPILSDTAASTDSAAASLFALKEIDGVAHLLLGAVQAGFNAVQNWLKAIWDVGSRQLIALGGEAGAPPPDIPALAAGGIVIRPGLAFVGEAGAEVVTPIGDFLATIGATAEAIGDRIAFAMFQLQQQQTQTLAQTITTVAASAFKPFDFGQKVATAATPQNLGTHKEHQYTLKDAGVLKRPIIGPNGQVLDYYDTGIHVSYFDDELIDVPNTEAWLDQYQPGWRVNGIRAMAAGGLLTEPVYGVGINTGLPYRFAENGPERVTPGAGPAQTSTENHYHFAPGAITIPARDLDEMRSVQDFFDRLLQTQRARG
jgi:TP901 family phage tail tape measure protein